jgi:S-DNA-T family DNA segregation ATPase FtsK/SpoIIIE
LHPIVVGLDECQRAFEHPEYGAELTEICTDLVKRGPALGIILIVATQRPDKASLPTGISANVSTRFCLKVMGQIENDMVLGTGAYKAGVRASMFAWGDKGIGYLVGEGAGARIVHTVYLDRTAAQVITARARVLREQAGRLAGYAIGQDQPTDDVEAAGTGTRLLRDVLAVVPAAEPKVWNETVVARLGELRPEIYGGWEPEQLTAALKPFGITTGQVWGTTEDGKGANRRGITRAHVTAALTERGQGRGGDGPPMAR